MDNPLFKLMGMGLTNNRQVGDVRFPHHSDKPAFFFGHDPHSDAAIEQEPRWLPPDSGIVDPNMQIDPGSLPGFGGRMNQQYSALRRLLMGMA